MFMAQTTNAQATSSGGANNVNTSEILIEAQSDAALAGAGGIPSQSLSAATTINSLEDLKRLSPELYNQILASIAQNMMIDFKNREDRLEQEIKKMQNNDS
jgi:hypothetical protein